MFVWSVRKHGPLQKGITDSREAVLKIMEHGAIHNVYQYQWTLKA
jgi:hypothetical protein